MKRFRKVKGKRKKKCATLKIVHLPLIHCYRNHNRVELLTWFWELRSFGCYCVAYAVNVIAIVGQLQPIAGDVDDCDDAMMDDFEHIYRAVYSVKIQIMQRPMIKSNRQLKWKRCPLHFSMKVHCAMFLVSRLDHTPYFRTTIYWTIQSIHRFRLMIISPDWLTPCEWEMQFQYKQLDMVNDTTNRIHKC